MKTVQKAVIKDKEKFLILLRSADSKFFPGHWDFPGGKLEEGEDPKSGIVREVLEETRLKIKPLKIANIYEMTLKDIPHRFVVHDVKTFSRDVKLSEEHTKFRWATRTAMLKLKIEPYMRRYFKEHK